MAMTYGELKKAIGMTDPPPECRRRIYLVGYETVLRLARGTPYEAAEYIAVPVLDLPEGANVLHVYMDHLCGGFGFVVEHESFDPVPEGEQLPHVHGKMRVVELAKKDLQEGAEGKQ